MSAFDRFCLGAALGRFPQLASRDDLWRLLVVIIVRKVLGQGARKRGVGQLVGESVKRKLDLIREDWLLGES